MSSGQDGPGASGERSPGLAPTGPRGSGLSMDKHDKHKFKAEIIADVEPLVIEIAGSEIDHVVTPVKAWIRKNEAENAADKKRMSEHFDRELYNMSVHFKKALDEAKKDFREEMREI